jgi:hypothetical protein
MNTQRALLTSLQDFTSKRAERHRIDATKFYHFHTHKKLPQKLPSSGIQRRYNTENCTLQMRRNVHTPN